MRTYIALRWHRIGHANDENLNVADAQLCLGHKTLPAVKFVFLERANLSL